MADLRSFSDQLPPALAIIMRRDDGGVRVHVDIENPSRHELLRISQHLLELAGYDLADVARALQSLPKD